MRFGALVLACVGMALGLALSGSLNRAAVAVEQDEPLAVRILGSGFAVATPSPIEDPAMEPRRYTVALVIENPNPSLAAEGLRLDFRLRDGAGTSRRGRPITVAQLLPGERRNVVATETFGPTQPEVVAVEASVMQVLRWRRVGAVPVPGVRLRPPVGTTGSFSVPGLSWIHADTYSPGSPGGLIGITVPIANVTITNALDAFVAGLNVTAVAFDREGRIIGGGQATQALAPHESAEVTVGMTVSPGISAIARLEVTAAYPWIDLELYER